METAGKSISGIERDVLGELNDFHICTNKDCQEEVGTTRILMGAVELLILASAWL